MLERTAADVSFLVCVCVLSSHTAVLFFWREKKKNKERNCVLNCFLGFLRV